MTSNDFDIQIPATEAAIAEVIRVSDPDAAGIIRRLVFERDRLRERNKKLQSTLLGSMKAIHALLGMLEQRT